MSSALKRDEDLPGHDLEAALGLVGGVERVHGVAQGLDAVEARRADQARRVEAEPEQMLLRRLDGLEQGRHQFLDGGHDVARRRRRPSSSPRAYWASASRRLLSMPL